MKKHISFLCTIYFLILISCNEDVSVSPPPYGDPPVYPIIDEFPAWSPDGKRIIYNHSGITRIDIGGSYKVDFDSAGLWMINLDGTEAHLLLVGAHNADWSPEGSWITFEQGAQIYRAPIIASNIDIAQVKQLTTEGSNFFPSISPDGQWIAFDSNKDSPNGMNFLWKMKVDGTEVTRIAYDPAKGEIRMPDWSSTNSIVHIRYIRVGASEIFKMDVNGTNSLRLTFNDFVDYYPKYSPEGNIIVFESNSNVWIMNADGANLKQLTANGGLQPSLSPDGQYIVFIGFTDKDYDPENNGTIFIRNINGGNRRQLTYGPKLIE